MTANDEKKVIPEIAVEIKRYRNLGLGLVVVGFCLFMVWAAWAPLAEGVPAAGQVAVDTKRKTVQHANGGVIAQVMVKEGDRVREGATLMRLDDSLAKANLEAVRQRYQSFMAMRARLFAERDGLAQPIWPAELLAMAKEPSAEAHMRVQSDLLRARRAGLLADQDAAKQSMLGIDAQIQAIRAAQPTRQAQLESLKSELQALLPMFEANYVPRNRQYELQRQIGDLQVILSDLAAQQSRLQAAKIEIQQRVFARESEYRKEAQTQLAEVTRDLQSDAQRMIAVQEELSRTDIKAPVDGQVVGLAYQTVGGVIPPTQKIMDIVPSGDGLVLEVRVPPAFIDRVRQETMVDIRFTGFAQTPQLVAEGVVKTISADALTDPQTGQTYFLARVVLTQKGMTVLGQREMQPGMTAEVVFLTGSRSLLDYLLHPLTKRLAASMKEE